MLDSLVIAVQIACPFEAAYAYAADPANWPAWAAGLGATFHPLGDGQWAAHTPGGEARIRFAPKNPHGVLDHTVTTADGQVVEVPMRMMPNGDGVDVVFTLFRQPGMSAAQFELDAGQVRRDLDRLRDVLERGI